jgi:hypothetical protein
MRDTGESNSGIAVEAPANREGDAERVGGKGAIGYKLPLPFLPELFERHWLRVSGSSAQ